MGNTSYVVYSQINSLEEFGFIAGTEYTLTFNIYEDDGVTPLDMSGGTFTWVLSPYGETYSILSLNGTIVDVGIAEVSLSSTDTATLSGKYIQQPIITSFSGEVYRPAQGIVLILPKIT